MGKIAISIISFTFSTLLHANSGPLKAITNTELLGLTLGDSQSKVEKALESIDVDCMENMPPSNDPRVKNWACQRENEMGFVLRTINSSLAYVELNEGNMDANRFADLVDQIRSVATQIENEKAITTNVLFDETTDPASGHLHMNLEAEETFRCESHKHSAKIRALLTRRANNAGNTTRITLSTDQPSGCKAITSANSDQSESPLEFLQRFKVQGLNLQSDRADIEKVLAEFPADCESSFREGRERPGRSYPASAQWRCQTQSNGAYTTFSVNWLGGHVTKIDYQSNMASMQEFEKHGEAIAALRREVETVQRVETDINYEDQNFPGENASSQRTLRIKEKAQCDGRVYYVTLTAGRSDIPSQSHRSIAATIDNPIGICLLQRR